MNYFAKTNRPVMRRLMHAMSVAMLFTCAAAVLFPPTASAEDVGDRWGTEEREREYYRVVNVPTPKGKVVEAGAFELLPNGKLAIGTRHGDIYTIDGIDVKKPNPTYKLYASGLDEIFGLAYKKKDKSLYVTQSCELSRLTDTDNDGEADRFETVSDAWGYGNYHEYAFGSKFDKQGNLYVALGLSNSYHSRALFRGWAFKITPEGKSIPIASGLRSPGGIGPNEHDALFYIESQGPWNSSCSLKAITPGSFHGHPVSFNWYKYAPHMGPEPQKPESGKRIITEKEKVKALVPYAVIFPYIRMGRSITGFVVNRTKGKFGPFENQIFIGDYTQSIIMRATTEKVNGIWQGACYPFREGLSTGILNVAFTPHGNLICGGTNRGWPVRGIKPFALERLDWTGVMPFEIKQITITKTGFRIEFTKAVDKKTGNDSGSYKVSTFTHIYHGGYGGPEVDQTKPTVKSAILAPDGMSAIITLDKLTKGHCHEFDLGVLRSKDKDELLHKHAYYTVNEIPK
jgi:glucose/arabinose dehydrogenase